MRLTRRGGNLAVRLDEKLVPRASMFHGIITLIATLGINTLWKGNEWSVVGSWPKSILCGSTALKLLNIRKGEFETQLYELSIDGRDGR